MPCSMPYQLNYLKNELNGSERNHQIPFLFKNKEMHDQ